MSLHLKYIIQAFFYKEKKITACNFVKTSAFVSNQVQYINAFFTSTKN